jgi:hypothetical protein
MRIDLSSGRRPAGGRETRLVADNDDDPLDPPPARAARPPLPPVETIALADAVERMARAA